VTSLGVAREPWRLRELFRFAGYVVEALDTARVVVCDGAHCGWGEGVALEIRCVALSVNASRQSEADAREELELLS
jgi:hypothetical protein